MKRFWVEFEVEERVLGCYMESKNALSLRLSWTQGKITELREVRSLDDLPVLDLAELSALLSG